MWRATVGIDGSRNPNRPAKHLEHLQVSNNRFAARAYDISNIVFFATPTILHGASASPMRVVCACRLEKEDGGVPARCWSRPFDVAASHATRKRRSTPSLRIDATAPPDKGKDPMWSYSGQVPFGTTEPFSPGSGRASMYRRFTFLVGLEPASGFALPCFADRPPMV